MSRRLDQREARLRHLAELIRTEPLHTSIELAALVGVYVQTLNRYIRMLRERGTIPEGFRPLTKTQIRNRKQGRKWRPRILKGIASGISFRGIARSLGVGWIRVNAEVTAMHEERDPRLTAAVEKRTQVERLRREAALKEAKSRARQAVQERPPKPMKVRAPKQPKPKPRPDPKPRPRKARPPRRERRAPKEHRQISAYEARLNHLKQLLEANENRTSRELCGLLGIRWETVNGYVRELKRRGVIERSFELLSISQARVIKDRERRRDAILEGVAVDKTYTAIGAELGVSFSRISADVRSMKAARAPDYLEAEAARDRLREERRRANPTKLDLETQRLEEWAKSIGTTLEEVNRLNREWFKSWPGFPDDEEEDPSEMTF